jgi:ketosteroid isomerase-like protein
VREIYEAINESGLEAAIHRFHPDFEGTVPPELSAEPDTYRGHEGLRRYFAGFEGSLEDVRIEPLELVEDGDRVLVPMRLLGRGAGSGIEVEQQAVQVWSFRDGKVARVDGFTDLDSAREAGGP